MIIDRVKYLEGLRKIFTENELQRSVEDDIYDTCVTSNIVHFKVAEYTPFEKYRYVIEHLYRTQSHIFIISLFNGDEFIGKRRVLFSVLSGVKFEIMFEELPNVNVIVPSHQCTMSQHDGHFAINDSFTDAGMLMVEINDKILHFTCRVFISGCIQNQVTKDSPLVLCLSFKYVDDKKKEINVAKVAVATYAVDSPKVWWDNVV